MGDLGLVQPEFQFDFDDKGALCTQFNRQLENNYRMLQTAINAARNGPRKVVEAAARKWIADNLMLPEDVNAITDVLNGKADEVEGMINQKTEDPSSVSAKVDKAKQLLSCIGKNIPGKHIDLPDVNDFVPLDAIANMANEAVDKAAKALDDLLEEYVDPVTNYLLNAIQALIDAIPLDVIQEILGLIGCLTENCDDPPKITMEQLNNDLKKAGVELSGEELKVRYKDMGLEQHESKFESIRKAKQNVEKKYEKLMEVKRSAVDKYSSVIDAGKKFGILR